MIQSYQYQSVIYKEDTGMKKLLVCDKCGKMLEMVQEHGCPTKCCGEPMRELQPNTTDAAVEKHVPVVAVEGNKVKVSVGSVEHPMTEDHRITWIALYTDKGMQRKFLEPGNKAYAEFALLDGEKLEAAYAYCNLHGLWEGK